MGIQWYVSPDGSGRPTIETSKPSKPILLLFPGLSGGTNNLYTHSLADAAIKKGFKCGVVLFRCSEDIPITSCRLTCAYSSADVTETVEHVYNAYVRDQKTKEICTRLYVYGTSLGANILSLHLIKHGSNAKVDGAMLYCPPYDIVNGVGFFYNNLYGAYSYMVGMFLNSTLNKYVVPHLIKHAS